MKLPAPCWGALRGGGQPPSTGCVAKWTFVHPEPQEQGTGSSCGQGVEKSTNTILHSPTEQPGLGSAPAAQGGPGSWPDSALRRSQPGARHDGGSARFSRPRGDASRAPCSRRSGRGGVARAGTRAPSSASTAPRDGSQSVGASRAPGRRFPSPWEPQRNGRARGRRDRDRAQGLSWLGRRGPSAHRGPLPTAGLGAGTCPGTGHPAVRPGPAQPGLRARLRGSVRGSGEPRAPRRPSPLRRAGPAAPTGRDGTGQPAGPSVHGAAQPLPGPRVPPRRPARPSRESPQRQRRHLEAPRTPEAAVTHFRPHRPGLPVPPGAARYPRAARHPWGSAR